MNMVAKLPTLDDGELTTLHANAKRLIATGTAAQQTAAADLMPSIEAELGVRNAAKIKQKVESLAAKRAKKAAAGAEQSANDKN